MHIIFSLILLIFLFHPSTSSLFSFFVFVGVKWLEVIVEDIIAYKKKAVSLVEDDTDVANILIDGNNSISYYFHLIIPHL